LQKYFFIALGGSIGSIARYWVGSTIASRYGTRFYYGTFVTRAIEVDLDDGPKDPGEALG
jgi:fluoride ion exporter CrcB/FEX